jgi:hypothetical protein
MVKENCEVFILGTYSTQTPKLHALNSVGNKDTLEYPTHTKYKETLLITYSSICPYLQFSAIEMLDLPSVFLLHA